MQKKLLAVAVAGALAVYRGAAIASLAGAVVNTKSTSVTNLDTKPPVLMPARLNEGRAQILHDFVASANGDSAASTYRVVRCSTSDIVDHVFLDNDALGGAAAGDIGVYDTNDNGGAVIDADLFASAVSLVAAARATDVTRESGVITIANQGKQLWEQLALTSDPRKLVDIVVTLTAASAAAGNVALKLHIRKGN